MSRVRSWFFALLALAAAPLVVQASIQQQRAQITVNITIDVTPAPVSMRLRRSSRDETARDIAATFHTESVAFVSPDTVAQNQNAVKVEASVGANPNGNLLYSNQTGVQISQTAGTTVTYPCEYQITVNTTVTSWSLDHGLYSDFESGTASFTGHDLSNNSYLSTPHPTYSPFVVYSDGQNWALLQANGGTKTYCVSLQVTIPATAAQGTYSSNAVYTLLY
jgi:hypothetical protein